MMPPELKGIIGIPLTSFNAANEFDPGPLREQLDFFVGRSRYAEEAAVIG